MVVCQDVIVPKLAQLSQELRGDVVRNPTIRPSTRNGRLSCGCLRFAMFMVEKTPRAHAEFEGKSLSPSSVHPWGDPANGRVVYLGDDVDLTRLLRTWSVSNSLTKCGRLNENSRQ